MSRQAAPAEARAAAAAGGASDRTSGADAAAAAARDFVDFFAAGWSIGATEPERFYAHIGSRLTADAPMIQPLAATTHGHAGLRALFAPLFATIPDLRGDVVRWGATADGVVVELRLQGTLGGRPIAWTVVDRIILRDGSITERRSYFDPLPLVWRLLRSPVASRRLVAALVRRGR